MFNGLHISYITGDETLMPFQQGATRREIMIVLSSSDKNVHKHYLHIHTATCCIGELCGWVLLALSMSNTSLNCFETAEYKRNWCRNPVGKLFIVGHCSAGLRTLQSVCYYLEFVI